MTSKELSTSKSQETDGSADGEKGSGKDPGDPRKDTGDDAVPVKLKRKGRRGRSSGTLTMKGDKITSFTTDRGIKYHPNDHVFIENNRPNQPYFICAIQDFSVTRRDTLVVKVKWYYRVSEVPDSVYQHLVQDRYGVGHSGDPRDVSHGNHSPDAGSEQIVKDPRIRSRELFVSEATDTYPVTALRGKCRVVHCQDVQAARDFQPSPDGFYYILGYNPETRRLATTQGQIRVGSMHQARMPECKPNTAPCDMPEQTQNHENLGWQPQSVLDGDLMMYLRAARSVAAFAGMCDGGSTEDGCQAASMDDTTINAMEMLHRFEYDTGRALQALVKSPALRTLDKKWNEEDTKRFVKGLRLYGKNFFKIRKELLSHRETGELVEYYYFWKKTPQAAANRPHRRHRRHGVKRATTRSQRPASSEFLDLSSGSECSDNDSEDSDTRDLGGYRCQNCFVTVSKDWSNAGKPRPRLCSKCRIFFKKYGEDRPLDSPQDAFPYYKDDEPLNGDQSMRTRQNRDPVDSKDKKKIRNSTSSPDIQDSPQSDLKKSRQSPSTLSSCSTSSIDRDKKKEREGSESPVPEKKKRHHNNIDQSDQYNKRKRREDQSDSESVSDCSSISGNDEENGNDGDIENTQDDLSSSSLPTSPSPVESDYKKDKSTPAPVPLESTLDKDKLSELPRPEPQHPRPQSHSPGALTITSPAHPLAASLQPQALIPLPALPPFAFPQQPLPESLFTRQPLPGEPLALPKPPLPLDNVPCSSASPRPCDTDLPRVQSPAVKIKVERESPPPPATASPLSPRLVTIKQEPRDTDYFDSSHSQAPSVSVNSSQDKDTFSVQEHFDVVIPKVEPVQSQSPDHGGYHGDRECSQEKEKSAREIGTDPQGVEPVLEMEEESESDREGTLTPGPTAPCNREVHRSKSAIFIKLLNRGEHNSCTRCDLMFKPLPDSRLARRREEREKKVAPPTPAKEEKEKRKAETPPPNPTADALVTSSIPQQHHSYQDRVTPRSYQDTPALRQLSEYAKPHVLGQDPRALPPYSIGGYSPFIDPLRMAAIYPPNSRERLEMELERDKRERDARERELREHELRTMEMREKLKAELEMKPPGLERLLPPGANPLDPHWLEIQRRYGYPMVPGGGASGSGSHIPGVYPPTSIASDLMQRERERLERLGMPGVGPHPMLGDSPYSNAILERLSAERMSAERLSAERLSAERYQAERMGLVADPMARLQMGQVSAAGAAAAAAAAHAHTHTHAHSHTHLHLHQPDGTPGGPQPPPPPPPMPQPQLHPLLQGHLLHSFPPGADPMAGVNGVNTPTPPGASGNPHPMSSLPPGVPPHHLLSSREQELIQNDLYRRAYSDPALAQQLQAQHEVLQRMAMERERFGSGHLPPPH